MNELLPIFSNKIIKEDEKNKVSRLRLRGTIKLPLKKTFSESNELNKLNICPSEKVCISFS
jgi:hypothetical protein